MPETQGRGPLWDEGRIERHNQRPLEQGPGVPEKVNRILDSSQNHSGSSSTGSVNSLSYQLEWCITMRKNLKELQLELRRVSTSYGAAIEELISKGYKDEFLKRMLPMREEFSKRTQSAVTHIDVAHLEYINRQADAISTELSTIMNLPKQINTSQK
jgi:hypothetical protein